jgi:hypothetical protein
MYLLLGECPIFTLGESMIQNNPLRQYFRRPAVYLKLPSGGKFYTPDIVEMPENGELPVYPMTAIDDITVKTPDALFNGQAVIDIIKSCIPSIKNPWGINSIDLDAILIAIRSASTEDFSVTSECPACSTPSDYKINLGGVLSGLRAPDYAKPLIIGDLSIKFRPLNYKDMNEIGMSQFEMQRQFGDMDSITDLVERTEKSKKALQTITELSMRTIAKTIHSVTVPNGTEVTELEYILDFLRNCDKTSYEQIKDYNTSLRESGEMKPFKIKCIHCSHEYDQPFTLNVTDFFE